MRDVSKVVNKLSVSYITIIVIEFMRYFIVFILSVCTCSKSAQCCHIALALSSGPPLCCIAFTSNICLEQPTAYWKKGFSN